MSDVLNLNAWERITLITKPEQSGKTFLMIQQIIKDCGDIEDTRQTINFIFCSNSLLLTKQTGARVGMSKGLIDIGGEKYIRFSSSNEKDSVKTIDEVFCRIIRNGVPNIICCTNKWRVDDVPNIIEDLNQSHLLTGNFKFNIWLDEADTAITFISKKFVPLLQSHRNVKLNLMTATPEKLFNKFKSINVLPLEDTTIPTYHGWEDNRPIIVQENATDTIGFAQNVLTNLVSAKKGSKWFIPSDHKKTSHKEMRDMLNGKNFAVFIVNGDGIELTIPGKSEVIIEKKNDELNTQIKRLYEDNELSRFPIAITGHFCITRGITIATEDFMIDGAILSNCQNKQEVSQTAGRVKGNWKEWANYKIPEVFTTEKFNKIAIEKEQQSRNLALMAKEQLERGGGTTMNRGDLRMAGKPDPNISYEKFNTFEEAKIFVKKHFITDGGNQCHGPNKPKKNEDGFVKKYKILTFEQLHNSILENTSWSEEGASAKKAFPYYEDITDPASGKWAVFFQKDKKYYKE
uniref:Uncharacterized protein n=1 Tax=viral metagenome TaxID=1070528 RepID=A0A6C0J9G6_9ZZZZ